MTKKKEAEYSVSFFYNLDFQIIKINLFNEVILIKSGFVMFLEILDSGIQPDRISQIHFITDGFQPPEYFVGSGILGIVTYYNIS